MDAQEMHDEQLNLENLKLADPSEMKALLAQASPTKRSESSQPGESLTRSALLEALLENHPGLTRERASQMLDEVGA
jgi:hypothetical protein